jgi:hypothetical protein
MTTEQRLEKLERENRWMRRIGVVAVAVAAIVFLVAQGKNKVPPDLVVRSLAVKDRNGRIRARLFLQERERGEEPILTMEDPYGTGAYVSPGGLGITGAGGKSSAGIGLSNHRAPGLQMTDTNGRIRVSLSTVGAPTLEMRDAKGKTRVWLTAAWDGPALELSDKDANTRAALGATDFVNKATGAETKTAESTLTLFDAKGSVIWQAPR